MRGKGFDVPVIQRQDGITPAYAGKRYFRGSALDSERDHPRLCGEKRIFGAFLVLPLGSPPPMRGKAGTVYLSA